MKEGRNVNLSQEEEDGKEGKDGEEEEEGV